jgi:hypothetical protein
VDVTALIGAFGGGVLGAAVGAVPIFIVAAGVLAIVGVAAGVGGSTELLSIAFGPVLGPHVSFAGGVAAAAYAGSRGALKTGRDIGSPLMGLRRVDVLLVGGAFGAAGYALHTVITGLGFGYWTDTVALVVVISNLAARLVFGSTGPLGRPSLATGRRFRPDDSATWLPWQQDWQHVAIIGVGVGLAAAYITAKGGLVVGRESLSFGISNVILVFLVMGNKAPVTHHISMPAALAVVHGGGILMGGVFGLLGACLGEAASRAMLIHGDTHIDPPAVAIGLAATLLLVMKAAGIVLPAI